MAKITPLQDRIVLRKMEGKTQTASGLLLNESPNMFTVESVGPKAEEKLGYALSPGDKVLKGQYSGDDVKVEGEYNLTIVAAEYILAKVD